MEKELLVRMALTIDIISVMASLSMSKLFDSEEIETMFEAIRAELLTMGYEDDALSSEIINKFKNATLSMSNQK